jgi:stress-induced morphogen
MISEKEIETMIKQELKVETLIVNDLSAGSHNHWEIEIKTPEFNNIPKIKQHRKIYEILKEPLASEAIHALMIKSSGTEN